MYMYMWFGLETLQLFIEFYQIKVPERFHSSEVAIIAGEGLQNFWRFWVAEDLHRATPAVTRGFVFAVLPERATHLGALHEEPIVLRTFYIQGLKRCKNYS